MRSYFFVGVKVVQFKKRTNLKLYSVSKAVAFLMWHRFSISDVWPCFSLTIFPSWTMTTCASICDLALLHFEYLGRTLLQVVTMDRGITVNSKQLLTPIYMLYSWRYPVNTDNVCIYGHCPYIRTFLKFNNYVFWNFL